MNTAVMITGMICLTVIAVFLIAVVSSNKK